MEYTYIYFEDGGGENCDKSSNVETKTNSLVYTFPHSDTAQDTTIHQATQNDTTQTKNFNQNSRGIKYV